MEGHINKVRCARGLTFVSPENMTLTHARNIFPIHTTLNMELYINNQALKSDATIQQGEDRLSTNGQSKNPIPRKYE